MCKTGQKAAHFSQNCWGHDVRNLLHPFDVDGFGGRILGEEVLVKNFGRIILVCVKQGKMQSKMFCTHSMSIIFGKEFWGMSSWEIIFWEEFLGKNSWGRIVGRIIGLCVKQGEMLPTFLRVFGP